MQLGLFPNGLESGAAKEVARYRDALKLGFRSTPGTALMNDRTEEVIDVPAQDRNEIITAMSSLEAFISLPVETVESVAS